MSYKVIVKGRGFDSFSKAYKKGDVRISDEIRIGVLPKERYVFIDERDGKLLAINDPVMAFSFDIEELIGEKRWKAKRYVNSNDKN